MNRCMKSVLLLQVVKMEVIPTVSTTLGKFHLYNYWAFQKFIIYLDVFLFFFISVRGEVKSAIFPSEV